MSLMGARASAACIAAALLAACGRAPEQAIAVLCSEIAPAAGDPAPVGAEDVLELVVVLDSVPAGPGSVRVRVDALADPGVVRFFLPPLTAAAAGMALAPPATFQGCAALAPVGLELRAATAPRAKAWVRVSTDRAVRVRPRVAGRGSAAPVTIVPGTSGMVGWER